MRKVDAASVAASKQSSMRSGADRASLQLVCLALTLALVTLACRICSVW